MKVIFSRIRMIDGMRLREFHELPLERDFVAFLPMNWTVVHPIDEESPLRGETPESLAAAEAEWLIYLTGIDETFNQMVVVRSSYRAPEVIFGAKFRRIFEYPEEGPLRIDVRRIHEVDRVDL